MPDGTILAGHKRVAAMKRLGWSYCLVRLRLDLAEDPEAARRRLIEDNLTRRQLTPLSRARCYRAIWELEHAKRSSALVQQAHGDLRDRIGKSLGICGRHLSRLIRIVEHTPVDIQYAVDRGELPMVMAEQVAGLTPAAKKKLVANIRAGRPPKDATVEAIVATKKARKTSASDLLNRFVRGISRAVAELEEGDQQIEYVSETDMESLQECRRIINTLLKKGSTSRKHDRELAAKVKRLVKGRKPDIMSGHSAF